jgi:hypothetical protein
MSATFAAKDSIEIRLAVCGVAIAVGIVLIISGIYNIRTKSAEEAGHARLFNHIFGRSNTYVGKTAVTLGILRIISGVAAIGFGIVFVFVGPFLAG